MEKCADIRQWLDDPGRDYFVGVQLYEKYGQDVRLKVRVFPLGNFLNNRKTLEYELRKIWEQRGSVLVEQFPAPSPSLVGPALLQKVVPPAVFQYSSVRKEFPRIDFETIPDQLKVLVVDRIALNAKANDARKKKFEATTDEERLKWNLLEIESRIENRLIWKELNHFQETGKVLGEHLHFERLRTLQVFEGLSRKELLQRKKNFPPAISKANKAIREAGDNQDVIAKKQALLRKYNWQEKAIDRLLGL
jgi:hypothetical protein